MQVKWWEEDLEPEASAWQTGFIIRVEDDKALIDCDAGPRKVWVALSELTPE